MVTNEEDATLATPMPLGGMMKEMTEEEIEVTDTFLELLRAYRGAAADFHADPVHRGPGYWFKAQNRFEDFVAELLNAPYAESKFSVGGTGNQ